MKTERKTALCTECHQYTNYITEEISVTTAIKGTQLDCEILVATCTACNTELYVPEYHDENIIRTSKAYKKLQ